MPTRQEVEAQLLGPGGMFEVVTDTVNGIEMKVYKDRLPSLRSVAELGGARGDDTDFIVYGDRRYGFGTFLQLANSVSNALSAKHGIAHGDRVAVLSARGVQTIVEVPHPRDLATRGTPLVRAARREILTALGAADPIDRSVPC